MNISDAIDGYVKLRDQKNDLKKKHDEEMAPYNDKLKKIEAWLMKKYAEDGIRSSKSNGGATAFIQSNDSVKVTDQEAFMDFVKTNDHFELLDVRASKTVIRDFMENTKEIPPGIAYNQADVVRVRR